MGRFARLAASAAAALLLLAGCAAREDAGALRVYPVLSEPRHKPVFRNDRIDVYRVHLMPGEGSFYHRHARDQVGISLHDYTSFNQIPGQAETAVKGVRGTMSYIPHTLLGGSTHRVRAVEGEMWVVGIEFAAPAPAGTGMAAANPGDPALEFPQGRITRLRLAPGDSGVIAGELIVPMTAGTLEEEQAARQWSFGVGDVRWLDGPASVHNAGAEAVELAVLDLK
jgi:hypothetical protein